MAVITGRFRPRETGYWAVQLRRSAKAPAVTGRYLCHERDRAEAELTAARLAKAQGAHRFSCEQVAPPFQGWRKADLPGLGAPMEVSNLFLWSLVLAARSAET
jgi:hypothetical protein